MVKMDTKSSKILDINKNWNYTITIVRNSIFTSIFPQLVAGLLWFFYAYIKINEATRLLFLLMVHFCLQNVLKAEMYIFNASLYR